MSKKSKPFLAHSELTDCIYIIDGDDKYEVTEQCISAMKATNRMPNVLDKIKSEIDSHCSDNRDRNDGLYIAMKIIDKYKAESEE